MKKGIYKQNLVVPFLKILMDLITIELAVLFSYYLRFHSPLFSRIIILVNKDMPPLKNYFYFSIAILGIYLMLFGIFRSYRSRFFASFAQDMPAIFKTCFLGILLAMSVAFMYRGFSYSRIVFFLIFINMNIFLLIERFVFHRIKQRLLKKGFNRSRICLIGSSINLPQLYQKIKDDKNFNLDIVGYIGEQAIKGMSPPFMGNLAELSQLIEKYNLDGLVILPGEKGHHQILDIMKMIEGKNIELFYIPDIFDIITSNVHHLEIGRVPVLQLKAFTLSGWQGFLKRGVDIVVSLLGLILLSPFFILIFVLIKLNSRGPIFYTQERVSLDGKGFTMWKFRSMYVTEESKSGLIDVVKDDPRVTVIGKILRRSSLDELPQLYNVLMGDMSLVGPRPERHYYVEQNLKEIPRYSERHRVRCGITGWAQVNGLRQQSTSLQERIHYDLYYIENWSLWFDLKIIIMTFLEVSRGENAY